MAVTEKIQQWYALLDWQDTKDAIRDHANLSQDALHIYAALAIFIGACILFRWKPSQWKPWLLVLAAQCLNEYLDVRDSLADDGVIWIWGNIKDMANTMLAPTVLLVAARYFAVFGSERKTDNPDLGDEL